MQSLQDVDRYIESVREDPPSLDEWLEPIACSSVTCTVMHRGPQSAMILVSHESSAKVEAIVTTLWQSARAARFHADAGTVRPPNDLTPAPHTWVLVTEWDA
jgi:hypothetical protein